MVRPGLGPAPAASRVPAVLAAPQRAHRAAARWARASRSTYRRAWCGYGVGATRPRSAGGSCRPGATRPPRARRTERSRWRPATVRPGQATDPQRAGLAACRPAIDTAFAMRRACIADALMAQWAAFPVPRHARRRSYFTSSSTRRCSSSNSHVSRRSFRISAPYLPCTMRAFTMRCRPSGVRGPCKASQPVCVHHAGDPLRLLARLMQGLVGAGKTAEEGAAASQHQRRAFIAGSPARRRCVQL